MAMLTIDERGKRCPVPVISLGRTAAGLSAGTSITVLADDPAAEQDIAAWCRMRGALFVGSQPAEDGPGRAFTVVLGESADA